MSRQQAVLVTGAARGIGAAIAERFASTGNAVLLMDNDEAGVGETAAALRKAGAEVAEFVGDVAREGDVTDAVDAAVSRWGEISAICNNAGIETLAPFNELSLAEIERVMAVNVVGMFNTVRAAHRRGALPANGAVVNVSSIMAFGSEPGYSAYVTSKAAILGLTRSLAQELGPSGVRVNAVCPGYIDTALWQKALEAVPDPDAYAETIARAHPLRRRGTPADVAAAVEFLASEDASFVTGAVLVVDGGLSTQVGSPFWSTVATSV